MDRELFIKEINNALGAHGAWKLKLNTALTLSSGAVTSQTAKCDKSCAFGAWLHGSGIDAETRRGMPYQVVKRLHAEFHDSASRVLSLSEAGRKSEAANLLASEFTERSEKLRKALTKWKSEIAAA